MSISSAATTLTTVAAHYNSLFPQMRLKQLSELERDLLKWLPKADDLYGDGMFVKMRYQRGQGFGSNFAQGQANITSAKVKRTFIERQRYHGFVSLDDESVLAATKGGGAGDLKEADVEDMITGLAQELEGHLWRGGVGIKGTIAAITDANPSVITLTNQEDIANFNIGEVLECRSTAAADRGGDEAIASIDFDAAKLTMTTNVYSDHAWDAADVLVRGGVGTSSDYGNVVSGIGAWNPATAETSGTFLGMDRTDDIIQLQGFRQAYMGSIEETIKKLRANMGLFGGRPDSVWLNDSNWHRLEIDLGARAVRQDGTAATFGLPTLKYSSPKGNLSVYSGALCPVDVVHLLKRDTWMLHHMGGLPHLNPRTVTGQDYDGIEIRGRYWAQLANDAMKHNGRGVIA